MLELMAEPAMAPYASATDGTSAVMFVVSLHDGLWVYMVIVSEARYIINAEKVKGIILDSYYQIFITLTSTATTGQNCIATLW